MYSNDFDNSSLFCIHTFFKLFFAVSHFLLHLDKPTSLRQHFSSCSSNNRNFLTKFTNLSFQAVTTTYLAILTLISISIITNPSKWLFPSAEFLGHTVEGIHLNSFPSFCPNLFTVLYTQFVCKLYLFFADIIAPKSVFLFNSVVFNHPLCLGKQLMLRPGHFVPNKRS